MSPEKAFQSLACHLHLHPADSAFSTGRMVTRAGGYGRQRVVITSCTCTTQTSLCVGGTCIVYWLIFASGNALLRAKRGMVGSCGKDIWLQKSKAGMVNTGWGKDSDPRVTWLLAVQPAHGAASACPRPAGTLPTSWNPPHPLQAFRHHQQLLLAAATEECKHSALLFHVTA